MGCFRVPLTRGREALIDARDVKRVGMYVWTYYPPRNGVQENGYRKLPGGRGYVLLDRFVANAGPRQCVNHANDDQLDCRSSNLRIATRSDIAKRRKARRGYSSIYKGVSWDKDQERWSAAIKVNGKQIRLGRYRDELRAAEAYDEAATKFNGEYARLNFPSEAR